jgi:DNA invertase Pin-like site-specific DNA recombinase
MPKIAFSYVRFSTAEQAKGDSLRRQLKMSRDYAAKNGFVLDESLQPDKGISAFKGRNRTEGNLAAFLARVKDGTVAKGSALLIESLDRLSREEVEEALYAFLDIIRSGIEIHTLSDGQVYIRGKLKTEQLMVSIFVMSRANEESVRKSERIGEKWTLKRHNANGQEAMSARVPLWLRAEKGHPIAKIPERTKLVRQMYEWAAKGLGQYVITDKIIALGVPAWGPTVKGRPPKWTAAYVGEILRSRTVLGWYQPMTKVEVTIGEDGKKIRTKLDRRVPNGPLVKNYYPQVVPLPLWQKVQEVRKTFAQSKFGESLNAGKDKFSDKNLFRKLVFDASNNAPMTYRAYEGHPCLVTTYREHLRQNKISYPAFENAFLNFLSEADWKSISRENDTPQNKQLLERQEQLAKAIDDNAEILKRYEQMIDNPDSKGFVRIREKYKLAVEESERLLDERNALEAEISASNNGTDVLSSTTGKEFVPRDRTSKEARLKLRLLTAQRVRRIDVYFGKEGAHGLGEQLAKVYFSNGVERWIAFGSGLAAQVFIKE